MAKCETIVFQNKDAVFVTLIDGIWRGIKDLVNEPGLCCPRDDGSKLNDSFRSWRQPGEASQDSIANRGRNAHGLVGNNLGDEKWVTARNAIQPFQLLVRL